MHSIHANRHTNRHANRFALAMIVAVLGILGGRSYARDLPKGIQFEYVANKESLADMLKNFASSQGLAIVVSPKVTQVVNGKFSGNDPQKFLNDLSQVFGLIWFFDGSVIYVNASDEVQTKMIKVPDISAQRLDESIRNLGILDSRYNLRYVPGQKMIYVSGPPRYVELVNEVAQFLGDERNKYLKETTNVHIFRLKYALAYDRSYTSRGETVVVKGLASVLKDILGDQAKKETTVGPDPKKTGMPGALASAESIKDPKTATPEPTATTDLDGRITSDRRLNAIVINDRPEKMAMYQALIDSLDVPSEQVEISVSIMDVSSDHLSELGFDWRDDGKSASVQFGSRGNDLLPPGGASGAYGVQTIVAAKAGQFMGKIKMLSEDGDAQIFSRPVVLTKDMVEAVIDNSSTFYVRVAGKEDVNLFPVTYGTLMRVTPRIVDEDITRWIHMDINIEDGQRNSDSAVDQIPDVKKTSINTQSMIPNGDSLLIGGYIYTSARETSSGVPILEDIPLIGHLFSWDSNESRQWVRLFMISPRTVTRKDMLQNVNHPTMNGAYQRKVAPKMKKILKPVETKPADDNEDD